MIKNNLEIDSEIKDISISEDDSENNNLFEIQDNFFKDNTSIAYKALIKNINSLDIKDDFIENNIELKLDDLMYKKPHKRKHDSTSVSKEKIKVNLGVKKEISIYIILLILLKN